MPGLGNVVIGCPPRYFDRIEDQLSINWPFVEQLNRAPRTQMLAESEQITRVIRYVACHSVRSIIIAKPQTFNNVALRKR
jgi:hypothetical protein